MYIALATVSLCRRLERMPPVQLARETASLKGSEGHRHPPGSNWTLHRDTHSEYDVLCECIGWLADTRAHASATLKKSQLQGVLMSHFISSLNSCPV
jgi:hypothetical protein